jgi:hypothetical protein
MLHKAIEAIRNDPTLASNAKIIDLWIALTDELGERCRNRDHPFLFLELVYKEMKQTAKEANNANLTASFAKFETLYDRYRLRLLWPVKGS